ncbi:MAG: bifunctional serine/threonine-protein kinase/formylglycine-generating enzyme family protein [Pseudomonadota bacterium]
MSGDESSFTLPEGKIFSAGGRPMFKIMSVLGTGGFGITYRVKHRNGTDYAMKEYFPQQFAARLPDGRIEPFDDDVSREKFQWGLSRFTSEAAVLARCRHDNIVKVIGATISDGTGTGYFLMEYEHGRTLHAATGSDNLLDEPAALRFGVALLDGLAVVHANGLIHRDIKPANIYVCTDGRPVLLDFGSARDINPEAPRNVTQLITPGFSPHEQYESSSENQGPWTDIYSLAASLLASISGESPRAIDTKKRLVPIDGDPVQNIIDKLVAAERVTTEFAELLSWALDIEQMNRPQSAVEFRQRLVSYHESHTVGALTTWAPARRLADRQVEKDFTTLMGDAKLTAEFRDRATIDGGTEVDMPRMMIVPTGSFMLGSPPSEPGREDAEGPQLWVELRNRFAMSKYLITNAQYAVYLSATGADASAFADAPPTLPATGMNWKDAHGFTHWLSQISGKHYRLPSEQEWEWSCRARATTAFPWGSAWDPVKANAGTDQPSAVGEYPANDFGLHDCTGNVREWVADAWHNNHVRAPTEGQARTPPRGMPLVLRVTKGGTWNAPPEQARTAARYPIIETERRSDVGFRVLREV